MFVNDGVSLLNAAREGFGIVMGGGDLLYESIRAPRHETIVRLAGLVTTGELDLVASPDNPVESICQSLLKVKGLGPWTVNYAMLRGYGHADCSLHGNVAVRAAIAKLWGHETRPDTAATEVFLRQYSPHRTMAAAHLWASLNTTSSY